MEKNPYKSTTPGVVRCVLPIFGLPFLAVGCYVGFLNFRMIADYCAARTWVETPATILKTHCEVLDDSDGVAYRVTCTYSYSFSGRQFERTRVGLSDVADDSPWQKNTYRRLRRALNQNQPVPCFIDPAHPDRALLDRTLRWQLVLPFTIMMLFFGSAGGICVVVGIAGTPADRYARRMAILYPDEPWRWEKRWSTNVIHSKSRVEVVVMWIGMIVWNGFMFIVLACAWPNSACAAWIVTPFTLGFFLLVFRATRKAYGWHNVHLVLETMPGFIGKPLKGNLIVKRSMPSLSEIIFSLRCVQADPEDSNVKRATLWEDRRTICLPIVPIGQPNTVWSVDFEIPESCEPSDDYRAGKKVTWEVGFQATTAKREINLAFEVPVFRLTDGPKAAALAGQAACVDISRVVSLGERR